MNILNFYYKVHEGVIVNGPFELPDMHWLSPGCAVALKDADGKPVAGIEGYGYVQAISRDDAAANLVPIQIAIINHDYVQAVHALVADTPPPERESWYKQEAEARAWAVNSQSLTPYIDGLAAARGIPREYLLSRVLDKVALYEAAHAALTGKRQALEDALKALPEGHTVADVLAVSWS